MKASVTNQIFGWSIVIFFRLAQAHPDENLTLVSSIMMKKQFWRKLVKIPLTDSTD